MGDRAFVDTNVLVYAHERGAGAKHEAARALVERLWQDRSGIVSTQVLQELYVNVRRVARNPLSGLEATQLVEDYLSWEVVVNDAGSILEAIKLEARHALSFWDALIVQAAIAGRADVLYTEDLNPGERYGEVRVVDPFAR